MAPKRLANFAIMFHHASEKGLLLLGACIIAMFMANSSWQTSYAEIINNPFLGTSFSHFVNDGLMAIFFLLVGLEIKREMLEGELSTKEQRILPVVAAIGGVIGPILIYVSLNYHDPHALRGWAVPAATDIAFALGMFALLGRGLPVSLRIFLTALAIVDDLIAVILIALFYTTSLSLYNLGLAFSVLALIIIASRAKLTNILFYLVSGVLLWYFTLKSGIHSTVAGVALGMSIPLYNKAKTFSPIRYLERILHPLVLYIILPIFAFINSGVSFKEFNMATFQNSITLGIILGLFFGKQIGICASMFILTKLKLVSEKKSFTAAQFYAVSVLCGIGFTMSLFVGNLAFNIFPDLLDEMKVGVLTASLLSSVVGGIVISLIRPRQ